MKKHLIILAVPRSLAAMNAFGGISGGASQKRVPLIFCFSGPLKR